MRVLVACEKSGVVRRALRAAGLDAGSCDLEPAQDGSIHHIQEDALRVAFGGVWDAMIAHPECRFLCASGLHWNTRPRYEWRDAKTTEALAFALELWGAPIPRVILENSRGKLGKAIAGYDYRLAVQPYHFGDDASKETWFWFRGIKPGPIYPAKRLPGRLVTDPRNGKVVERWGNQTDSGQNRLGPSPDRSAKRAETYPGVADWLVDAVVASQ